MMPAHEEANLSFEVQGDQILMEYQEKGVTVFLPLEQARRLRAALDEMIEFIEINQN